MNKIPNIRVKCGDCPIKYRAVCSRCDDDEINLLEHIKVYRTFEAGQPILWRGDDLTYLGSLVYGVATISKTLEDGRTQMVGLLLPSDFIGRPGRASIEFDVTAITDVTLCCFDRKAFESLLASTPHLAQRLMEMMLDELDAARDWMLLLGRKTAREKLASFLQMLVVRQSVDSVTGTTPELALPLTREEIADYLGLTLETVSRQISKLKSEGIVSFSDRTRFEVLDKPALHAATGNDD